jgi:hypothetical protein
MLEALGNIGDLVGGIAVLITLVYLSVQVRQHTASLHTANRQDLSAGYRAHNERMVDPEVSRAYAIGLRQFPDMPADQARTFTHMINDHTLFLQAAFALYESGELGMENFSPYLTWLCCHLATPGGAAWWQITRGFYNTALVETIDAKLAEGGIPDVLEHGFYALD